jgi:hypothetical protein
MLALKRPEPRAGVLEIEPYVSGSNATAQGATVFKLSSNETPLGPSPDAVCAYHEAAEHLAVYPDGSGAALRAVIGRAYALNPALIVCGAGSDELLNLLAHAFVGPGDEAIHTVHGFLVFRTATLSAGGRPVVVPECNYTADVDAILRAVTPRTKIVFLANPNNPTGTYLPFDEIKRLRRHLAPRSATCPRCRPCRIGQRDPMRNSSEVERRDRAFASAATMIWASALTAVAVPMSVVIPRAAQSWPVRNVVAGPPSIVRRKERGRFLRAPSDSIRNSLLANTDSEWRKLT